MGEMKGTCSYCDAWAYQSGCSEGNWEWTEAARLPVIDQGQTSTTRGDLTRSIQVEAQGEAAALQDNINEMIRNLKDTTL
jgi:hypothetical protein